MDGEGERFRARPGELRRRRRAAVARHGLASRLGSALGPAAARACRRVDAQGLWTLDERRRRAAVLVGWAQARLGPAHEGESGDLPDPGLRLELGLSSRDAFALLSELRTELTKALFRGRSEGEGADTSALEALQHLFDEALFELMQGSSEDLRRRHVREERLVMMGQLVASLIHELRNPLSVIDTSLLLLERRAHRGQSVDVHVARARSQVDRSRKMIDDLLDMLRERPTSRKRVVLRRVLEETMEALGAWRDRVSVEVEEGVSEVEVDPGQIQQVVLNLLTNALEASDHEGSVRVRARQSGGEVVLEVEDQGPGIAAEILPTLFEPLVSTKPNGVGLGLAVSRRLAEQNLGRLEAQSHGPLGGALFRLTLPVPGRLTEPPLPSPEPQA